MLITLSLIERKAIKMLIEHTQRNSRMAAKLSVCCT